MTKSATYVRTRKNRDNPYVMIDKYGVNDDRLSWKAKGILVYLLSKPDDWKILVIDLIKKAKDGRDSVRAGLKELEVNGYIEKHQERDEKGRFGDIEYIVYERPQSVDVEGDTSENGFSENGKIDNGKPTPTNNNNTNNESNYGRMGDFQSLDIDKIKNDWERFKEFCQEYDLDGSQTMDMYKTWKYQYNEAPLSIVMATIRELMRDKIIFKNGKFSETEYKNLVGLYHHRMKTWREMAIAFEDIDSNGGWS